MGGGGGRDTLACRGESGGTKFQTMPKIGLNYNCSFYFLRLITIVSDPYSIDPDPDTAF